MLEFRTTCERCGRRRWCRIVVRWYVVARCWCGECDYHFSRAYHEAICRAELAGDPRHSSRFMQSLGINEELPF